MDDQQESINKMKSEIEQLNTSVTEKDDTLLVKHIPFIFFFNLPLPSHLQILYTFKEMWHASLKDICITILKI